MDSATAFTQSDLSVYLRALWRRKWVFLTVVLVIPVAVYLVSSQSAKVYQSSTLVELQPTSLDAVNGAATGGPNAQFIAVAARLIRTTGVAETAARELSPPRPTPAELLSDIAVSTDPTTGFLTITARATSPQRAASIANAFAAAINSARAQQAVAQLDQQIAALTAQIDALPPRATTLRNQALAQRERLGAERAAQGTNAQVIEPAVPATAPVSPKPERDAALALVVATLLGLVAVALVENLDRRIRRPEEFEELSGLPVLCSVPRSAFEADLTRSLAAERFRTLRANLGFFNVDRDVRSIVLTSGRPGEGKSLVATGLALAYTAAGARVILVDADLRRPTIAARFGMPSGPGLGGVLVGRISAPGALINHLDNGRKTGLWVLPAGELPPNPAELLGSKRMAELIEELSSMSDLVVIDSGPLLVVSDALPLLDRASGSLLVVRLGVTRRDDLRRMRRVVETARSSALGIVVTGTSERTSYPQVYVAYVPPAERTVEASTDGAAVKRRRTRPLAAARGRRRI